MKKNISMQWHLSEACNLKCKHCYQENHIPVELPYEDLLKILDQYRDFLKKTNSKGHIALTGGEPLVCAHFFDLLEEFKKDKDLYTFCIMTNGLLLNDEKMKKIADAGPSFIQVSLEGGKETNDYVRGAGTYEKIGDAIKLITKYGVRCSVSFTATKLNYREFSEVVDYVESVGGDGVWSDRYIPLGGKHDDEFIMNLKETQEWLLIMKNKKQKQIKEKKHCNVFMGRALQFTMSNDPIYQCKAGKGAFTIMENGDIVPCRRMPIVVGNIKNDTIYDVYTKNPVMLDLQKQTIPEGCYKCKQANICRGGLKCLTYALTGNYKTKDLGCKR